MTKAAEAPARTNTRAPTKSQSQAIEALSEQVGALIDSNNRLQEQVRKAEERAAIAEGARAQPRRNVAPVALDAASLVDSGDLELAGDGDDVVMAEDPVTRKPYLKERMVEIDNEMVIDAKWAEQMRFNEEKVVVLVHPDNNARHPEPCVSLWNDGRHQLFPRGYPITVARKFLEVLARMKPIGYDNVEYVDEFGVRAIKYPKRVSHKYPFSVVRDDNPRGPAWLQKICNEP